MKYHGCVLEIRKNTMVVMTKDCLFLEVKRDFNAIEGMEVKFSSTDIINNRNSIYRSIAVLVASIALLILASLSITTYWQGNLKPVALITVDINPSIEIQINKKQEIITAIPLNKEAETLLSNTRFRGKHLKEGIQLIIQLAKEEGYLKEKENVIMLTSVSLKENQEEGSINLEMLLNLKSNIVDIDELIGEGSLLIAVEASQELLKEAKENNISVGKIYLNKKGINNERIEVARLKEKSIRDILKTLPEEHPVFEQHPGRGRMLHPASQQPPPHPIFEQHPGKQQRESQEKEEKNKKEDKPHPVFEQHPGKQQREGQEKEEENKKEDKPHPVFEQHPGKQQREGQEKEEENKKEDKPHPVFEQHPGNSHPHKDKTKKR